MRRVVTEEEMATDLYSSEAIEIRVCKHHDGYRLWVNEKEKGLVVRAYRVKELALDLDNETLKAQRLAKVSN